MSDLISPAASAIRTQSGKIYSKVCSHQSVRSGSRASVLPYWLKKLTPSIDFVLKLQNVRFYQEVLNKL